MSTEKSTVEILWDALRKHFGNDLAWHQLTQQQQHVLLQACNMFLAVVHKQV